MFVYLKIESLIGYSVMDVSIVVPAFNEEKNIERSITSLLNQDFKGKYEIIVVNDGSTDNTEKTVKEIIKKSENKIKLLNQPNQGPAAARNAGAKIAKGKIVLFTDSDCVVEKGWIKEMVEPFKNKEVVGVQGRYKIYNKESLVARFVQYEIEERYQRMEKQKYIDFIGSYSAGYRKDVFLKFGGFDTSFKKASGEDPEISYRIADKGMKMVFAPKAVVYHSHPDTLKRYLKMKYGRGYWGELLYKKHPEKRFGQSYNSIYYFLHIMATCLLSLLFVVSLPFSALFSKAAILLLILLSLPSTLYIAKFEKKFLFIGPLFINLRNLAIGYGVFVAKIKNLGNKA